MMATVTFSRLTFVKTQNSVFNGEEPSGLRLVWGKKKFSERFQTCPLWNVVYRRMSVRISLNSGFFFQKPAKW